MRNLKCYPQAFLTGFTQKMAELTEDSLFSYPRKQTEHTILRDHMDQVPMPPEGRAAVEGMGESECEPEEEEKDAEFSPELDMVIRKALANEGTAPSDELIDNLESSQEIPKGLDAVAGLSELS